MHKFGNQDLASVTFAVNTKYISLNLTLKTANLLMKYCYLLCGFCKAHDNMATSHTSTSFWVTIDKQKNKQNDICIIE